MSTDRLQETLKQIRAARRAAIILVSVPLLLSHAALAQTQLNSPERLGQFAKLPDWSGVWRLVGSPALLDVEDGKSFEPGIRDHPPYNEEWEAKYTADLVRAEHQGDPNYPDQIADTHTVYCAAGMPHIIGTPFDYQFIVSPEVTWLIVDKETRIIYTDGRDFPPADEMWPTLRGWSIGHWEGDTLVAETRSVMSGIWADFTPAQLSEQAVFTERFRQIGEDMIEDRVSISDAVALTEPWTFTKRYARMEPGTWVAEPEVCGNPEDRNPVIDGKLQVVLPGDE
jgi:hypothetical protein